MFSLKNTTQNKPPVSGLFLKKIKDGVLGKNYDLSVVLVGNAQSLKLNKRHRNKNKPANVLSFPLEKDAGEIFLDQQKIKSEVERYETTYKDLFAVMFIHGLLHLKGYYHGKKMEAEERRWAKKLNIQASK